MFVNSFPLFIAEYWANAIAEWIFIYTNIIKCKKDALAKNGVLGD